MQAGKKLISLVALALAIAMPVRADWADEVLAIKGTDGSAIAMLDEKYPYVMDWLRQDTDGDFRQVLIAGLDTGGLLKKVSGTDTAMGETLAENLRNYRKAAEKRRARRLNELTSRWGGIAFAERHNFQNSFLGYTEGLSDARNERYFRGGARLTLLEMDGLYARTKDLIRDDYGMIRDVDVSKDGKRILFAWKKSDRLDDYHIYEMDLASGNIRQLTHGLGRADYEPQYLPDGDIIFASTRPEQSVPCWWTEIANLYRMDADGRYIRRMAIDQVHTLYPTLLENGRLIYTRWDYSDRGQNYPHPVFSMNQDGTGQRVYYGGNSWFPNSLLYSRAIPGTGKVMAVAAGHHTRQRGKLVTLDVSIGRDEGKGMEFVAPRRHVDYERVDRAMQDGDQFRYPFPLDENQFLVSYSPDAFEAIWDSGIYGLYWMDMDGNRELLYRDRALSVGRPVTINPVIEPATHESYVDYSQPTGEYYVHDVYQGVGLEGIERGKAKKIRIVQLNYRAAGVGHTRNNGEGGESINSSPVAVAQGSWDVKEILGDVDIEADGSARFVVPAMKSIYIQVLDEKGYVIQNTRSWDTVRPGETKACKGCHNKQDANFHPYAREGTIAWSKPPQQLQPFYGNNRGFSFIKEIQPILDAKCVSCHDGSSNGVPSFDGTLKAHDTLEKRLWSDAYLNLTHSRKVNRVRFRKGTKEVKKLERFYVGDPHNLVTNWIDKMSRPTELPPYSYGAATSRLMSMLEDGHGGVTVTDEERHKFAAWLDLLVPFIGDFREAADWTPEEFAFYDYYASKRDKHYGEELLAIEAFMKKDAVKVTAASQAGTVSGYQPLPYRVSGDAPVRKLTFLAPSLIDRISHAAAATVRLPDGRTVNIPAGGGTVALGAPVRLTSVTVQTSDAPEEMRFHGVSEAALPVTSTLAVERLLDVSRNRSR